ncbi:hypothetical protein HDU96_002944 [Phlyctochytrium bullatum]|nr:hypothetical protein HDU96_002944 [Phlyctochytrium bullatum]
MQPNGPPPPNRLAEAVNAQDSDDDAEEQIEELDLKPVDGPSPQGPAPISRLDQPAVPKKKKKKKKKKPAITDPTEDGPAAPTPPQPKKVVFIDDPSWPMTTVPAGWGTATPNVTNAELPSGPAGNWAREDYDDDGPAVPTSQPAAPSAPKGWDDAPIRAMLQHAIQREQMLRERLASSNGAAYVHRPHNVHEMQSTLPASAQGWDAPIQGVHFISTGFAGGGGTWNTATPSETRMESRITELD